jgi:hypothetical protein
MKDEGFSSARFPLVDSAVGPVAAADHRYGLARFGSNDFFVTIDSELMVELQCLNPTSRFSIVTDDG